MSIARQFMSGVRALLHPRVRDAELSDEIRHYLEMATQDKMRAGLSRERAEREARLEFGGIEDAKERIRTAGWHAVVESVVRDARYALRGFRAAPTYAAIAVLTLSCGLGLTISVFTVAKAVLSEQWPVSDPSRVVAIVQARANPIFSLAEAKYFTEHATALKDLIAVRCVGGWYAECDLKTDDGLVSTDLVSANYFSALGLRMQTGRAFLPDDDRQDASRAVAIVSDAFWRGRLGSNPAIVGSQLRIDGVPFTVIGVAPREFTGTRMERRDVWVPLSAELLLRPGRPEVRDQFTNALSDRGSVSVAARLAAGSSPRQAEAELDALNRQFRTANRLDDHGLRVTATTFFPNPAKRRTAQGMFAVLLAAVVLVLLLACANVGNLLLARGAARRREIAVRLALGASRKRVVGQLIIESLLLATAAGAIGVMIASRLPALLMVALSGPVSWHLVPDAAIIAIAASLVGVTCVAFGLAPALHATRSDVSAVLKAGDDDGKQSSSKLSLRGSLLATQVAISVLLLVNAGMLVRGIQYGRVRDFGFRARDVAAVSFGLPASSDPTVNRAFVRRLIDERNAVVGGPVAFASSVPLGREDWRRIRLPGDPPQTERSANVLGISPEFLPTLAIPIVAGRDLIESDGDDAVLVNEAMARQFWPGENALGRVVVEGVDRHVVGVVKDANLFNLDRVDPMMFHALDTREVPAMLVRGASPALTSSITALVRRIDPRADVHVETLSDRVDQRLGGLRAIAALAGLLGVIALVIASVGVFGVFGYIVERRTREIGIRTTLGASRAGVIGLVLRDSARSIGTGVAIGLVLAAGVARLSASLLYGTSAFDPWVYGVTVVVLAVAAVCATYVPARRAALLDPMIALRQD